MRPITAHGAEDALVYGYKLSVPARPGSTPGPGQSSAAVQPLDLFATRIWQARFPTLAPRFADWIAAVAALRAAAPEPAGRSNRLGWNSADDAILDRPEFAELDAAVRAFCRHALNEMGLPAQAFQLQSWINIHDKGGFNFLHMHEHSMLSGTFYLQTPEGSGGLVLRDPRPHVLSSFIKGAAPNAHSDVSVKPEPGLIVLFPSWLEHFVEPHAAETPRISIPFNAIKP
ncbi:MAG: TIGR02466 family protein [Caulobacteraceae bacterium]